MQSFKELEKDIRDLDIGETMCYPVIASDGCALLSWFKDAEYGLEVRKLAKIVYETYTDFNLERI